MKCYRCEHELRKGTHKCPSCKAWNWGTETMAAGRDDASVLFEDVVSAELSRIKTGLIDENIGGGLVTEAVILLGGLPGAGKSTITLQLAAILCKVGECIYIAAEEGLPAIKARGDRLGINPGRRLRFIPALGGVADIGSILLERQPKSVILDSIDGLASSDDQQIELLKILKKYSDSLKAPVLVISQVNKDGDFAGLMAKQHEVDCLLVMSPEEMTSENGEAVRCLETLKNRHGRAFVKSYYEMTGAGLVPIQPPSDVEPDTDSEENDTDLHPDA